MGTAFMFYLMGFDKFEGWVGIDQFDPTNPWVDGFYERFVACYGEQPPLWPNVIPAYDTAGDHRRAVPGAGALGAGHEGRPRIDPLHAEHHRWSADPHRGACCTSTACSAATGCCTAASRTASWSSWAASRSGSDAARGEAGRHSRGRTSVRSRRRLLRACARDQHEVLGTRVDERGESLDHLLDVAGARHAVEHRVEVALVGAAEERGGVAQRVVAGSSSRLTNT